MDFTTKVTLKGELQVFFAPYTQCHIYVTLKDSKRCTSATMKEDPDVMSLIRNIVEEEVIRLVNQTDETSELHFQSLKVIVPDEVENCDKLWHLSHRSQVKTVVDQQKLL
ncbi:hypothetical protein NPIL_160681 [Nephila pilipes]|uniref:Uncharacterized protein n=1 Tax=Nephila pilipes TaxID=299642 RepID=A0A8X6T4D7_NEPPI|nr:hypothetical protein NPIL_160681 [Nephila pilipes]